jgi:hypothetical protein
VPLCVEVFLTTEGHSVSLRYLTEEISITPPLRDKLFLTCESKSCFSVY